MSGLIDIIWQAHGDLLDNGAEDSAAALVAAMEAYEARQAAEVGLVVVTAEEPEEEGMTVAYDLSSSCCSAAIYEVDRAVRWNTVEADDDSVTVYLGDEDDWDGDGFICSTCLGKLDLTDERVNMADANYL